MKRVCNKHYKHIPVIVKSHSDDVKIVTRGSDIWHKQYCGQCRTIFKYKDSATYKVKKLIKGLICERVKWFTTNRTQEILETENTYVKCPSCGHECLVNGGFGYHKVGEIKL